MKPQHASPQRKRKLIVLLFSLGLILAGSIVWTMNRQPGTGKIPIHSNLLGELNMELPDARNTTHSGWTKLDFYKQADADSAKRKAERARDPYYTLPEIEKENRSPADAQADKLTQQLANLNKHLHVPEVAEKKATIAMAGGAAVSRDVQQLESMMHAVMTKEKETDPEMEQLDGMLKKIMAIQHPVVDSPHEQMGKIFTVGERNENAISIISDSNTTTAYENGFYSIDEPAERTAIKNAFAAVIAENQTLVSGAVIKLRLTQDLNINSVTVPADRLVYGAVRLHGERLEVSITSIRNGQQLLPVKLSVYDLDGLPGIAIPGAITRDVAKQSAGQSIQNIGLLSVDPSIGAQATGAGIQAAKTLLQKKVQLTKVMVTAGYEVLLKNDK